MKRISRDAWCAQPWKNGGGITNEIWRIPEHGDPEIRISLAEVARSGPFSQFPGYRRWSFLVGTAPIELAAEVSFELVVPGDHVELPGEAAITATLRAGPTHLLNILVRTAIVSGPPPLVVGRGPIAHPVRFVFALAPRPDLARWESAVLEPATATDTTDCIWIA